MDNISLCATCKNNQTNDTSLFVEDAGLNWPCLVLILLPAVCIFGNSLVVLAVFSERSLKTTTNFLLVSLAVADVLIGALVMPFGIYIVMNNMKWYLDAAACNIFNVVDVAASTASIANLVAISVDRFYAVVFHTEYKTIKHQRRIYSIIIFTWVFSVGIGLPLGIGLNRGTPDQHLDQDYYCGIINPTYMLTSSICAFYFPCILMFIMYGFVFYRLNKRLRSIKLQEMAAGHMVQFGGNIGQILNNVYGSKDVKKDALCWAMPFLRTIEAEIEEDDSMSSDEIEELTTILHTLESGGDNRIARLPVEQASFWKKKRRQRRLNEFKKQFASLGDNLATEAGILICRRWSTASAMHSRINKFNLFKFAEGDPMSDTEMEEYERRGTISRWTNPPRIVSNRYRSWSRRRSMYKAKTKIIGMKDRALQLLMKLKSKQGMAIRKETRATKLVAIVLLLFLICWLPFFTLNIYKVISLWNGNWSEDLEVVFVVFTWLGYLNSCLNPIIYSLINRKFRLAFRKLLRLPIEEKSSRRLRTGQSTRAHPAMEQNTNRVLSAAAQVRVNRAKRQPSATEDPTLNVFSAIAGVKKKAPDFPASRARISRGLSLDNERNVSPRCRRAQCMQPLLYHRGSSDQGYDTSSAGGPEIEWKMPREPDLIEVDGSYQSSQNLPLLPMEDVASSSHVHENGDADAEIYRYKELVELNVVRNNKSSYTFESDDELL